MKYYKKIISERLYLSPINPDEVDAYLTWMNEDKTLAVNFGQYSLMVSSKNDLNWLYEPPQHMHRFAIVLLDNDELVEEADEDLVGQGDEAVVQEASRPGGLKHDLETFLGARP